MLELGAGTPPPIRAYAVSDGQTDDRQQLAVALTQTWCALATQNRQVIVAAAESWSRFRVLRVPATLPRRALQSLLGSEAADMLNAEPAEQCLAYQLLPPRRDDSPDERNVLLCTARRQPLESLTSIVRDAGLRIRRIQFALFARLNAWAHVPDIATLRAGRCVLLHAMPPRIYWHVLPPDAWWPDPTEHYADCPTDLTGNPDLSSACRSLDAVQPDAVLMSGPPAVITPLMEVLRAHLPACRLLANPFVSAETPSLDRIALTRAAPGLVQAFGLAAGE
jgi:Tfp pilus assembly PilM family ATPase